MVEKLKYFLTVASLLIFPLIWELEQPIPKLIGMGLISLLGLGWLVWRALKADDFRIPKFMLFILAFVLLQLVQFSNTPININGIYSIIYKLNFLFIFIFIVDQINSPGQRRFWENVLIGAGVIYAALDLTYEFLWYSNWWRINGSLFPLPSMILRSPGILFGHPNTQSSYLNLVTPFALVRLYSARERSARVFWFEILLILLVANFLTYSRGGWLSLASAILVTSFLFFIPSISTRYFTRLITKFSNNRIFWFSGIAVLILFIFGAGYLISTLMQLTPHGNVSGRLDIYAYALRWIAVSPLFGFGIGSIPALYAMRGYAIGGDEWYHTHNIWLEITLESGILGLALILLALGLILWAFRSAWLKWSDDPLARSSMAAYAGAGTAFLVHNLFDYFLWEASYSLAISIILGLIFSLAGNKNFIIIRKRYVVVFLSLILLTSFTALVFINRHNPIYWNGKTEADAGNWVSAREKLCQAADGNPHFTFYSFQCSLANAYVAKLNHNQEALSAAFQYQERALELDPIWYIHWANLASYEWQLGDYENAISHMQKALDMAPNRTFLQVSLAWMLEKTGDLEQAKEYYRNIYCSNPGFQDASIFQTSSLYQTTLQEGCPEDFPRPAFTDLIWAGHQALENGDFAAAKEYYQAAIPLNLESGIPYALMALVHQQSGHIQEANRDLQTAFLIENNSAVNHEIAGRIALADGDLYKGYQHLYEAFLLHRISNFSKRYYAYTYFDPGLLTDLSPYIPYSISNVSRELYEQLAEYLADQGEHEKSQRVTQWLEAINTP